MRDIKHREAPRPALAGEQPGIGFELAPVALGMGRQSRGIGLRPEVRVL